MWQDWNWINVFFIFLNGSIAISCFKDNRDTAGHVNMAAVVINGLVVASRIGI
jgi:hypothetical protein